MCFKATLLLTATLLITAAMAKCKPLHKLVFVVDAMKHMNLDSPAPNIGKFDRIDVYVSDDPNARPELALASNYNFNFGPDGGAAEHDVYVVDDQAAIKCYQDLLRNHDIDFRYRNVVAYSFYGQYNVFGTLSVYTKDLASNPCEEENNNKYHNNKRRITNEKMTSDTAILAYLFIAFGGYLFYVLACFLVKEFYQRKANRRWSPTTFDNIKVGRPLPQLNGERCAICLDDFFHETETDLQGEEAEAETNPDGKPEPNPEGNSSEAESIPDTDNSEVKANKEAEMNTGPRTITLTVTHPFSEDQQLAHPLAQATREVPNQETEATSEVQGTTEAVPELDESLLSATLICGHAFHTACLQGWFGRSRSCPTCRAKLSFTAGRDLFLLTRKAERARRSPWRGCSH